VTKVTATVVFFYGGFVMKKMTAKTLSPFSMVVVL
jgi:hypothetical protein